MTELSADDFDTEQSREIGQRWHNIQIPTVDEAIEQLRDLLPRTTPPPWMGGCLMNSIVLEYLKKTRHDEALQYDFQFITLCRSAVPQLLTEIERLRVLVMVAQTSGAVRPGDQATVVVNMPTPIRKRRWWKRK